MRRAYTTGEAAKIAGVTQKTIIAQCNRGELKHWKVPGSDHRRIERIELVRWMAANGMPLTGLGNLSEDERGVVAADAEAKGGAA
jgi:excisionase family DNA binding protein